MSSKKRKRVASWKVVRRCVVFFTTICVIPLLLFLLVTTDHYMRPMKSGRVTFIKPQEFRNISDNESDIGQPTRYYDNGSDWTIDINTEKYGNISDNESDIGHAMSYYIDGPDWAIDINMELGHTDKVPHSKQLGKNMTMTANRLERRRQFLKKACRNLGLDIPNNDTLHKPNPWEFLVSNKYRLIWCNVFKAASSSWMYNFNVLAGYSPEFLKKTKQVPLTLARQKYPRQTVESLRKAFNHSVSFLIVRHPLERLLSAYKDKIEYALPHSLHKKLGNQIIMKYRPNALKGNFGTMKVPTFREFISYLLDSVKNGDVLDMHWTPITEFCTPCMYDFDIIAHTETLQDDQEYLIYKAGLQNIIKPEWRNSGKGITSHQIEKYYSDLTRAQILQLYHIYRYDFELFNYTLKGYLDVGVMDTDPSALLEAINMKDLERKYNNPANSFGNGI